MKFLVINRPTGVPSGVERHHESYEKMADSIEKAIKDGTIDAAWSFIGGGHAYIVTAKDTKELSLKVRYNKLFRSSDTEIIPVADAVDFLRSSATHYKKHYTGEDSTLAKKRNG